MIFDTIFFIVSVIAALYAGWFVYNLEHGFLNWFCGQSHSANWFKGSLFVAVLIGGSMIVGYLEFLGATI